jgi:hypothetical protein
VNGTDIGRHLETPYLPGVNALSLPIFTVWKSAEFSIESDEHKYNNGCTLHQRFNRFRHQLRSKVMDWE